MDHRTSLPAPTTRHELVGAPAPRSHLKTGHLESPYRDLEHQSGSVHQPSEIVARYDRARRNVFFDKHTFLSSLLGEHEDVVEEMGRFLRSTAHLNELDEGQELVHTKPRPILERMAAIDLLEAVAANADISEAAAERAEDELAGYVLQDGSRDLTTVARRIIRAEQHDALVALTRTDPERALDVYGRIEDPSLASVLQDALFAGLVDIGLSGAEAQEVLKGVLQQGG